MCHLLITSLMFSAGKANSNRDKGQPWGREPAGPPLMVFSHSHSTLLEPFTDPKLRQGSPTSSYLPKSLPHLKRTSYPHTLSLFGTSPSLFHSIISLSACRSWHSPWLEIELLQDLLHSEVRWRPWKAQTHISPLLKVLPWALWNCCCLQNQAKYPTRTHVTLWDQPLPTFSHHWPPAASLCILYLSERNAFQTPISISSPTLSPLRCHNAEEDEELIICLSCLAQLLGWSVPCMEIWGRRFRFREYEMVLRLPCFKVPKEQVMGEDTKHTVERRVGHLGERSGLRKKI